MGGEVELQSLTKHYQQSLLDGQQEIYHENAETCT